MVEVKIVNHPYFYELTDIIKMYFGKVSINQYNEKALADTQSFLQEAGILLTSILKETDTDLTCTSEYYSQGVLQCQTAESAEKTAQTGKKEVKKLVKTGMYKLLSKVFGKEYPWGILTGIRPVKLVHEMMDRGFDDDKVKEQLKSRYLVSEDRIGLSIDIAKVERPFIYPVQPQKVSVYIGIPFCTSRCYYCSFTSNDIKRNKAFIEPYMESLDKEIAIVSDYMQKRGFTVQTVYIGGGTPTAITGNQLKGLIYRINESFGRVLTEFTCEAGRPDSITREKLEILKEGHVTRISINPQTMNDETLERVGRAHNTRQVRESFSMARETGFGNINMDLILGLPGEGEKEVRNTLNAVKSMSPESVTVHTMAIKRASIMNERLGRYAPANDEEAAAMMDITKEFLQRAGFHPYYLYRQKHMLQNLENIGYSKKGFESIYNIQIIEEKQSIVAFGADAATKAVFHCENRIERQHNIKDLKLYIQNIDRQIHSKLKLLDELPEAAK